MSSMGWCLVKQWSLAAVLLVSRFRSFMDMPSLVLGNHWCIMDCFTFIGTIMEWIKLIGPIQVPGCCYHYFGCIAIPCETDCFGSLSVLYALRVLSLQLPMRRHRACTVTIPESFIQFIIRNCIEFSKILRRKTHDSSIFSSVFEWKLVANDINREPVLCIMYYRCN